MLFSRDNYRVKKSLKKSFVILLACLMVAALFPVSAFANPERVDIFGYVRDDDTGKPISNAKVDLFYEQDSVPFISLYSDYNGRVDRTIYADRTIKRVEITRSGYKKALYTVPSYSHTVDLGIRYLEEGTTREDTYTVYGNVLDERDDSRISDARVVLTDSYDDVTYTGYTNSRGYFEVVNLPLGDYEVSITKYGYRDYDLRSLLRLRVGDYDLGTIRLERTGASSTPSTRTLTGRVTDEDGYFVQGAEVYLIDSEDEEIKTKTDALGYYTFRDITAQTYTIGVNAAGYELLERIDYVRIVSSDLEREVNLVVKRENRKGYDVYGRVVDENRDYIESVEVSLIEGNTRVKRVTSDLKGYYEFRYVPDGRYTIEFKKLGYQTKTLSNEVRVDGSYYPVPQVELTERRGTTTVVGGLVGDGQSGLSNLTAYLEDGTNSYSAKTNYFGFFTFFDVKEGKYNLYATINNTKKLLETNIKVIGARIDVGDININKIDSGYKVTGKVKDTGNYNVSGVKISVTGSGGVKKEALTDSGGDYSLAGFERGEYTITVTKEGYSTVSEKINITSFDLEKDFTLRPNDYIKANYAAISLAVDERIDLNKYISRVEIYSARGILLDTITSHYEIDVPAEYASYLAAYSNNEIMGKKAGEAYFEISIRNSRDYDNLSPALVKVTVTEPVFAREAVLTIGKNTYTLNGKTEVSDATPYLKDGRSFFPVRVMALVLGVEEKNIKWDDASKTAIFIKNPDVAEFTVGMKYYKLNGVVVPMDTQAENIAGRIYMPARFVSDALGGEIEWDNITKTLTLKSN